MASQAASQELEACTPAERGLDTTPAALFGRSTGGSGPPRAVAPTDLLAGGALSAAMPPLMADDAPAARPQPSPGGSGAIASQPRPGGMAGGSRMPLFMGGPEELPGSAGAEGAVECFRTTMGSALVVFGSKETPALPAAFSVGAEASPGAAFGVGMAATMAAPVLPLGAFAARPLPRALSPSRAPRARPSAALRPRRG